MTQQILTESSPRPGDLKVRGDRGRGKKVSFVEKNVKHSETECEHGKQWDLLLNESAFIL